MRPRYIAAVVVAVLFAPASASASIKVASWARNPTLKVVAGGAAEVDWTSGGGRHSVVIYRNGSQRYGAHLRARDVSFPTTGVSVPMALAIRQTPNGHFWALQAWQPKLPHRGYPPYRPGQTDWELDVSHWTGPIAALEVHADWAFDGQAHNLFGRLMYNGAPVHGFHTVKGTGAPQDRYGRSLYIDTFDSAYGSGWKRETSIVLILQPR